MTPPSTTLVEQAAYGADVSRRQHTTRPGCRAGAVDAGLCALVWRGVATSCSSLAGSGTRSGTPATSPPESPTAIPARHRTGAMGRSRTRRARVRPSRRPGRDRRAPCRRVDRALAHRTRLPSARPPSPDTHGKSVPRYRIQLLECLVGHVLSPFEVVTAAGPVLVEFFATLCGSCRRVAPTLQQVAAEYGGSSDGDADQRRGEPGAGAPLRHLLDTALREVERPEPGWLRRQLAEVDAKIADLQQVHATLAAVLTAGCSDLQECSCDPACPIPFAEISPHIAGPTDSDPGHSRGAGAARDGPNAPSSVVSA